MKGIIVFVFVSLFLLSLGAQATGECRGVIPFNASLLKQFGLGSEFACVYESPGLIDNAVLSFYSEEKVGNKLISSNSILLSLDDIKSGIGIPSIIKLETGLYQVLWDYPNGVDVIELMLVDSELYFKRAMKEMRLPFSVEADEVNSIVLFNDAIRSEGLLFSKVSGFEVFNKNSLKLKAGDIYAVVSVGKAFLYYGAAKHSKAKCCLIKGDVVKVLEYRSGFLKISYMAKNGKHLTGWVDLSSVI